MAPNHALLAEVATILELDVDEHDIAESAFDRLGFPHPAYCYSPGAWGGPGGRAGAAP